MLLRTITLSNSGNVCLDGGGYILALGYECTRGIYQLQLRPTGEWDGLTIRACWHLPDGTSTTTLAVDGCMDVPAAVTAMPGTGCITFEGAAAGKTITSSDLRYLVGDNSGVEDGALPEPNTPAWEQLVGTVETSVKKAEAAADQAAASASAAQGSLGAVQDAASKALSDIESGENTALEAITHRKEDAIATVGQAQTDATGVVQTAQQEAVAEIIHTGGTQVQAIATAGAEQVQAVEAAAAKKLAGITQLAGQVADSATKAEQAAQRAEDAADATSAIIDDTAVTSAKTWSSKGIVDTLCPPIKATGNPVVCYPVENYPLGVTASWEPTQAGSGDPSPDNIRPISGRDAVKVERCGENLLDVSRVAENKKCTVDGSTIHVVDTSGWGASYILLARRYPAGTYTIQIDADTAKHGRFLLRGYDANGNMVDVSILPKMIGYDIAYNVYYKSTILFPANPSGTHKVITFTVQGAAYFQVGLAGGISEEETSADLKNFALVPGTTPPTEYTPYRGDTLALALPVPCYGGELDAVTGKGQETWKVIELVGSEDWLSWGVDFKTPGITGFYAHSINDYDPGQRSLTLCSHTLYSFFAWGGQNTGVDFSSSAPLYFILSVKNDILADTSSTSAAIASLKEYLAAQKAAGTPVTVAYIKATPTPIKATGGKPIPALARVNTLLTDGDTLTVTGRVDSAYEMQQLRAAVVALGGTI